MPEMRTRREKMKVKCPFCKKEIEIQEDGECVYYRPWTFHIAIDHAELFKNGTIPREDILLWMYYPWHDKKFQKEMLAELKK